MYVNGVLWREALSLKTSLTPLYVIEVPVLSPESDRSCIYVLKGINFVSDSKDFLKDFRSVPTVRYFLLFI